MLKIAEGVLKDRAKRSKKEKQLAMKLETSPIPLAQALLKMAGISGAPVKRVVLVLDIDMPPTLYIETLLNSAGEMLPLTKLHVEHKAVDVTEKGQVTKRQLNDYDRLEQAATNLLEQKASHDGIPNGIACKCGHSRKFHSRLNYTGCHYKGCNCQSFEKRSVVEETPAAQHTNLSAVDVTAKKPNPGFYPKENQ